MKKRWLILLLLLPFVAGALQSAETAGGGASFTLTGTVTDPAGRPVAGISLWAVALAEQRWRDLPPSAVSGPDGSFSIPDLPRGRIDLHACGQGYLPARQSVAFREGPVRLELEPGAMVRGRVLDAEGAPLAGARVSVGEWVRHESELIHPWSPCRPSWIVESQADGGFEIGPLGWGEYDLGVKAPGSNLAQEAPLHLSIDSAAEINDIELRLKRQGGRKGSLTDSAGAPVPWAFVLVTPVHGESGSFQVQEDGSFLFFADPGPVTFRVEQEGYETFEQTIEVSEDEIPVDLVLVRDARWKTLRGRVTEPDDSPVADATIALFGADAKARSAADGSFEIQFLAREPSELVVSKEEYSLAVYHVDPENLPDGEIVIHLETGALVTGRLLGLTPDDRGPGMRLTLRGVGSLGPETSVQADDTFRFENIPAGVWKLTFYGESRSAERELVVRPGETEVTVEFSLPSSLTGKVIAAGEGGAPVPGVSLWAVAGPWNLRQPPASLARSGPDGSFTIPDPPAGRFVLYACGEGFLPWMEAFPSAEKAVEVTLEPAAALRGRVLGVDGQPLAGASVGVGSPDASQSWEMPGPCRLKETAITDDEGRFALGPLRQNGFSFSLWAEATDQQSGEIREVMILPGQTVEGIEIRVRPPGDTVTDPPVQPLEKVLPESGPVEVQTTDGFAREDRKECGPRDSGNVSDPWEGFFERWAEQTPAKREDPFFLDVPLPARGKVIGPDGAPVSGARITRVEGESTTSTADGSFEISVPAHGRNVITASKEGLAVGWRRVDAGGAPIENLEIQLHPEAMVIGRVLGLAPGEPDSSEELTLQGKEGPVFSARVSADGTFRLPQIPPGIWKLSMNVSGREAATSVLVPPGQTEVRADLQLPLTHPVAGRVLDERGEPLAGAQVLTWFGGRISAEISTETGADGRFTLALPDGEHDLNFRKEGYQWGRLWIEVQGAPVTGLSYRAERAVLLRGRLLGLPPGDKAIVVIEAVAELQYRVPTTDIEVRADGYSIPGLSPGLWRLTVRTPSCKLWRTIEIPPGTTEMDMDLDVTPKGPDWGSEP